jgi:hypothetical protein
MKVALAVVVVLTASVHVVAQAPIAPSLLNAKTVCLESAGLEVKALDEAANELRKRRLYAAVAARTEADLLLSLARGKRSSTAVVPVAGMWIADEGYAVVMTITDRASGEVLWTDRDDDSLTLKGSVRAVVRRLAERVRMVRIQQAARARGAAASEAPKR